MESQVFSELWGVLTPVSLTKLSKSALWWKKGCCFPFKWVAWSRTWQPTGSKHSCIPKQVSYQFFCKFIILFITNLSLKNKLFAYCTVSCNSLIIIFSNGNTYILFQAFCGKEHVWSVCNVSCKFTLLYKYLSEIARAGLV